MMGLSADWGHVVLGTLVVGLVTLTASLGVCYRASENARLLAWERNSRRKRLMMQQTLKLRHQRNKAQADAMAFKNAYQELTHTHTVAQVQAQRLNGELAATQTEHAAQLADRDETITRLMVRLSEYENLTLAEAKADYEARRDQQGASGNEV